MSDVKVAKDGTVTRDGDVIGKVVKEVPDGLHIRGQGGGLHVSFSQKPLWFAHDKDGTRISEDGCDTRKAAVQAVANHAEPLTVSDVRLERELGGDRAFIHASVSWQGNHTSVSRYPHERGWVIDMLIVAGSFFPAFSNGSGTRFTKPRFLNGAQHDAANAAAVEAGLLAAEDSTSWADLMVEAENARASQS